MFCSTFDDATIECIVYYPIYIIFVFKLDFCVRKHKSCVERVSHNITLSDNGNDNQMSNPLPVEVFQIPS